MKRPLPSPGPATIFERMSRLAQARGAINLGQGFPDFPEPPELIEAAARALRERSNQYPPMRGLPSLREAIAAYYARNQAIVLADDEIVVTSGATEALAATFLALVQPGDEVILVQPLYDAYLPLLERAGGVARFVDLEPPEWTLPLAALEAAISPRTRLIVLNTPNNPTGTVLDAATLEAVGALCERHDILLLCDEVWEAMLFDGTAHVSPMQIASLRDRTVKIGSAGKIFSLTGWKVGWACAAPPLAAAIAARHQFLTFTTATPLQWAVAEGLGLPPGWHAAHRARYADARGRFVAGLNAAGYHVLPASGTWFVTVDLAASGLPVDDIALSERLVEEAGVASIPVSAFYAERPRGGYLRLCFAKGDDILDLAVERLADFRRSLH
ncbi:MAG: aminotransferase [Sphingobium sp.]